MNTNFKSRFLRKNHAKGMPTGILYLDTETKTQRSGNLEKHRMDIAWTCSCRYKTDGTPLREIWRFWDKTYPLCEYIQSQGRAKTSLYVLGANIFFDLQACDFFHYFTRWGWVLRFYYESQLNYILVIKKGKSVVCCLSTTNFLDCSVAKLGELIGLEKKEVVFGESPREELIDYCRRDVEIIKKATEFYLKFICDNDLGKFSMTRASQAFHAYRHRFMTEKIYLHKEEKVKDLEREAYAGGRVECFKIGKVEGGPFVSLDVNSMYSFVMRYTYVPTELTAFYPSGERLDLEALVNKYCVVAEAWIDTDTPIYPVRQEEKLIFPVGRFKATLCTHALREALIRGHLVRVERTALYKRARIFTGYVNFFHELKAQYRREGNPIMERMAKDFLNHLYGKFGQRNAVTEEEEEITFDGYWRLETLDLVTGKTEIEYKLLNKYVRECGQEDGPHTFVAIAAHITEAARVLLWKIMEDIGLERVLYCDTDSIKVRQSDLKYLGYPLDPDRLGSLKVEDTFTDLELLGAKSYVTEKERKIKGVPKKAEDLGGGIFSYQTFLRQRSHMEEEITRYFITRDIIKDINYPYDKGYVSKEGTVKPFTLSEF